MSALSRLAIVNGTACSSTTSSVVLLNLRDAARTALASCSGTIISKRAILTAAHCLTDAALVIVEAANGEQIRSASVRAFPGYRNDSSSPDAGIVLMDQDLDLPPLAVLVSREARTGETAVVAGWGQDENGEPPVPTLKAGATQVSVVGPDYLQTEYRGSGTSGVCHGDSGGPILVSQDGAWAVAGITSATTAASCAANGTSYYTNAHNAAVQSFIFSLAPDAARR